MPKSHALVRVDDIQTASRSAPFTGLGVEIKQARPGCFRSDARLRCTENGCSWRQECRRLVAEWRR